ncbi:Phytochrome-like protein cph1 [Marinomonas aquimarina]|uniref:histidine kinase n=1 Tax=Marinomonas aquimarina TaxID=295068 RepID=A0A1A8TS92_9GAMM|nr:ATP-binding protein [Marinomonas aquimarina]SBS35838.1 Phytochrome-like protein cph1 [Marinomonas aquimarina]
MEAHVFSLLDPLFLISVAIVLLLMGLLCSWRERSRSQHLRDSNQRLQDEIQRRQTVEEELRRLSNSLENEVQQRTRELQDIKTKLEQEIHASAQAQKRMSSIFESAPNGMLVVNREGKITQANSMVAAIFRCQVDELIGQSVESLVPSEFRERHEVDRSEFQAHPAKRKMGARRDLYGARFDGSYVPLEVGLHPVELESGTEIVAAVVDISERKAYEKSIHKRNEALELSNRELQEFAFIASHDLREPLRKIISFSTLLQEGEYGEFNEEGKVFSGYIVNAAQRMRDLLSDLLAYSRVTSKANPFKSLRLIPLLEEVIEDLELRIEESQADIQIADSLPDVNADPVQIRQLFQNLIGNSLKYRHPERTPVISITGNQDEDFVYLKIQDNGIGFAQEHAEQIFDVFKRLHDRQAYTGTGMGLAICRKIVVRHGGAITARSEEGVGTTMIIELPKKVPVYDGS